MADTLDLLILGGGSAALSAARVAASQGKTVALVEDRAVGGACPNWACVPSKYLIEAARAYRAAIHPAYPGLPPAVGTVDFPALMTAKDQLLGGHEKHYDERKRLYRIEIGRAEFVDPHGVRAARRDGTTLELRGDRILIATGANPRIPMIEGLSDVPYFTSDWLGIGGAAGWDRTPESMLVLGGGYIALELGQMFQHLGTSVTLLEQGGELLSAGYEKEVGPAVRQALSADGMRVETNVAVSRFSRVDGRVRADAKDGRTWTADRLLIATGRTPNTQALELHRAGVETDGDGAILVDPFLRTGVSHIYAAGDVIARQHGSEMATPVANVEGTTAAKNALGVEQRRPNLSVTPRAIFTDPEVAVVGATEAEAGPGCRSVVVPMTDVLRSVVAKQSRGFLKMIVDARGKLVGTTMVGLSASEVIHEAAIAIRCGATVDDFVELIHIFPTMAEAVKIAGVRLSRR